MTRTQAQNMMVALAGIKLNADAQMRFDNAGNENWNVALDPTVTYTGAQLGQIVQYCATNNLVLSIIPEQMGVT